MHNAPGYLTRSADESPAWPFGQMDPIQAHRHEQARKVLLAREERVRREKADDARRELFARLGEGSL